MATLPIARTWSTHRPGQTEELAPQAEPGVAEEPRDKERGLATAATASGDSPEACASGATASGGSPGHFVKVGVELGESPAPLARVAVTSGESPGVPRTKTEKLLAASLRS